MIIPKEVLEAVKEGLASAGVGRFAVRDELDCVIIEAPVKDDVILLAVFEGKRKGRYVIKVTLASKAVNALWGCEGLKYSPYGLYAIIDDVSIVKEVIEKKVRALLRLG